MYWVFCLDLLGVLGYFLWYEGILWCTFIREKRLEKCLLHCNKDGKFWETSPSMRELIKNFRWLKSPRNLCYLHRWAVPSFMGSPSPQGRKYSWSLSWGSLQSPWAQVFEYHQSENCHFWFWTAHSVCPLLLMQLEDKSWMAVTASELINWKEKKKRNKKNCEIQIRTKLCLPSKGLDKCGSRGSFFHELWLSHGKKPWHSYLDQNNLSFKAFF